MLLTLSQRSFLMQIACSTVWFLTSMVVTQMTFGQTPSQVGRIERLDPDVESLIPADAFVEVLAAGFTWTEGPVWITDPLALGDPVGSSSGYLLFSDIPRNSIFRYVPDRATQSDRGITLFMQPSGYTGVSYYGLEPGSNGLTLDRQGRLIVCEHGDRRVSRLTPGGGKLTLVDHHLGKRLNSPNDAVVDSRGNLYFTDPPYGLPERAEDPQRELDFCGVYRLGSDGELTLLTRELDRPNGIGLSPDESTLYVAQSDPERPIWMSFPLASDGTIGPGTVIANAKKYMAEFPGLPDGLAVHSSGMLFASGPGGIYVMTRSGKLIARLVTGGRTSNCTFNADESALYITADDKLCRVKLTQ